MPRTIHVLIDSAPTARNHAGTLAALTHAIDDREVTVQVVPTDTITPAILDELGDGVVIGPGSPYRNEQGALDVIRAARERGIPLVGT